MELDRTAADADDSVIYRTTIQISEKGNFTGFVVLILNLMDFNSLIVVSS